MKSISGLKTTTTCVSPEQLICFYLLNAMNHATQYAFPVWWPTSNKTAQNMHCGVQILPRALFFLSQLLSALFHSLNLPLYKVFIFVYQIKFFVNEAGRS